MRHLYVHVPFCARRCTYCDFAIAVRRRVPAREYVEAVLAEVAMHLEGAGSRELYLSEPIATLYFGGGTPSLLPPDAIGALLTSLLDAFSGRFSSTPALDDVEVTIEANPEDVTPAAARAWRDAGVNRISLGAQSFDDRVLQWMHRSHDSVRIGDAVRTLRAGGFENISLDLIFGLPAELERNWARDLDELCSLVPTHCSIYGLTVEQRTPLARWISRGATSAPDDERYAVEYLAAHERLTQAGYRFYEVSSAARDGWHSRHNSAYWTGAPYVGLGPAAHSFDGRARRWNLAAWEGYRRAVAAHRLPVEGEEVLTEQQRELERLYLALRTAEGLSLTGDYRALAPITGWVAAGWAEVSGGSVRLRPEGWLRLDLLLADLTGNCQVA